MLFSTMALTLLDLPAEILHTIFSYLGIYNLDPWLHVVCPDELLDEHTATEMRLNGEMRLRAIAIDAHRHFVGRFRAAHVLYCAYNWHIADVEEWICQHLKCVYCQLFRFVEFETVDTDRLAQLAQTFSLLPVDVVRRVFRGVLVSPYRPIARLFQLAIVYDGKVYPYQAELCDRFVVSVDDKIPVDCRNCTIVSDHWRVLVKGSGIRYVQLLIDADFQIVH